MITFYGIVGLLLGIGGLSGAAFFFRQPKSLMRYRWGTFSIVAGYWGLCSFGVGIVESSEEALLIWKFATAGIPLIAIEFMHGVLTALSRPKKHLMIFLYAVAGLIAVGSFVDGLFVSGVRWAFSRIFYIIPGPLFILVVIIYFGLAAYGMGLLWHTMRRTRGVLKVHMVYSLIGSLMGFAGGSFYFLPAYGIDLFYPVIPNVIILVGSVVFTYAVLKLRILGIKSFIRSLLFYVLVACGIGISVITFLRLKEVLEISGYDTVIPYIIAFSSLGAAWIGPRLIEKLRLMLHKGVYGRDYDVRQALLLVAKKIPAVLDLQEVIDLLNYAFKNELNIQWSNIVLPETTIASSKGGKSKDGFFWKDSHLWAWVNTEKAPLVTEEIHIQLTSQGQIWDKEELQAIYIELNKNKIEAVIPLASRSKTVGMIFLGRKTNNLFYTDDDIQNIQLITASAGIALENARLYRESEQFGERLQEEVNKATKELQEANKELKLLDRAKNEFIRLASHQLYTPLTAARGYVSMMLEGEYGEVSEKSQKILKIVNQSTERLVNLVKNLLDITKIEAGHFRLTLEELRLEETVKEVVEELRHSAEEKGLALNAKIEENLNMLIGDKRRIRQAVMNLVDNGVKFTEKGSIAVDLQQINEDLQLTVSDTGRGLEPAEMEKLFQKFSRLPDAPLIHTEGVGLGLFIVQQIAREHNGMVKVESAGKGKGSIFTLVLPSAASENSLKIGDEVGVIG